jgi:hypothetical protein
LIPLFLAYFFNCFFLNAFGMAPSFVCDHFALSNDCPCYLIVYPGEKEFLLLVVPQCNGLVFFDKDID